MSTSRLKCFALISAFVCSIVWSTSAKGGVIANGDFSILGTTPSTFESWTTLALPVDRFVAPSDGGGMARFSITNFADPYVQLEQMFDLPSGAAELKFDFLLSTAAGGATGGDTVDSFQATLFDPSGMGVNPATPTLMDAFFSVDATGMEFTPASGVSISALGTGWRQVSLMLPSLAPGKYTLEFLMLGEDDELTTTVDVDNVMVSRGVAAIPEPASLVIWGVLGAGALPVFRRHRRKVEVQCGTVG